MFGFFRKNKPEDLMTFLKEGSPSTGDEPATRLGRDTLEDNMVGIHVEEAGGTLPPELEEAAVLFANGRTGEAATLINRFLLDHPENTDPQPWYMLFDLYELTGQRDHFEDAAVDFAIKFERSPPTWRPRSQPDEVPGQSMPQMHFGPTFGAAERARLPRFMQESAEHPMVGVDVSKVQTGADGYAHTILDCLVALQERKRIIRLSGGETLIDLLTTARRHSDLSEPWWLLLMEALQLEGRQADFEDTAIDYAVRFEVSPPSYTPPLVPPEALDPGEREHQMDSITFSLQGVISGNDAQLNAFRNFARDKLRVEVDLSPVERIDFASVGLLLDTLITLHTMGCKILFKEGNELVNVLLNIVGATQYAAVLGRTRV